ncbi:MAG: ABC transporter substrate-binding protein [Thermoplasmata archaeon]|nr:ABC transporter substrate-binding protein [Thermoplasmata archaeon]
MNSKMIAIIAAVAVVAIAVAAFIVLSDDSDENDLPTDGIVITDSLGKEVTIGKAAEDVVIISGNQAEFFQILGLEDKIVGASQTVFNSQDVYKEGFFDNIQNVGKYNGTAIVENIVKTETKFVISPTSMGLKEATINELKNTYGITTIILECFGETMIHDAEQIVKMFASESAKDALDEYKSLYNEVKDKALKAASKDKKDVSFLIQTPTMKGFYTDNSEQAKNAKLIAGHNSLSEWYDSGLDISGTFATPSPESIAAQSQKVGIDYYIVRGSSSKTLDAAAVSAIETLGDYASSVKPIQDGNMYVIHSDVASGCRDYIGFIIYAQIFGINVDADPVKLANEFNEKYGFRGDEYTSLLLNYQPATA